MGKKCCIAQKTVQMKCDFKHVLCCLCRTEEELAQQVVNVSEDQSLPTDAGDTEVEDSTRKRSTGECPSVPPEVPQVQDEHRNVTENEDGNEEIQHVSFRNSFYKHLQSHC